jgi:hypothetical protein
MPEWVLKLEGHVQHVRITGTSDSLEVLSIIDFITLVCKGTGDNYATRTWPGVEKKLELEGLVLYVPLPIKSPKSPYKQPPTPTRLGPVTTRAGLQKLLVVLSAKVKDEFRQGEDNALNRFILGDNSPITMFEFAY